MLAVLRQLAHAPIVLVGRTCLDRTLRRGRRALRRSTEGSGDAAIVTAPVASRIPIHASAVTFLVRLRGPRDASGSCSPLTALPERRRWGLSGSQAIPSFALAPVCDRAGPKIPRHSGLARSSWHGGR